MSMDLVVGDLEHAWYFYCGGCSTPPYTLAIIFTVPWYIWPNGPGSLNVCVSCSLSVGAHFGSRENTSNPNISRGS